MTPLSDASFDILLSLLGGPAHGYAMIQAIETLRGGRTMQPGLLYTTLPKLMDGKLIEECQAPLDNTDKRRKYYQITPTGRERVRIEANERVAQAQRIQALAGGVACVD